MTTPIRPSLSSLQRYALLVLSAIGTVIILKWASSIFIPLTFALLISLLLYPFCKLLERFIPRALASMLSILVFIAVLSGIIAVVSVQAISFAQDLPEFQIKLLTLTDDVQLWLARHFHINTDQQAEYLQQTSERILSTVARSLQTLFTAVTEFTFWTIFVFIFTFFILFHRSLFITFLTSLFAKKDQINVLRIMGDTRLVINSYITGLLLEVGIVAGVNILLLKVLNNEYAILLGLIVALLNLIPYLGIAVGIALTFLITFSHSNIDAALHAALVLGLVHVVDANILMPKVVGSKVNLNPLITILAVLLGGMIWGIAGMFLFIPLAAMAKVILNNVNNAQHFANVMGGIEYSGKIRTPRLRRRK